MAPYTIRILKEDSLGRVEWIEREGQGTAWIRRVACGGKWPFSGWLARRLMGRERVALLRLALVPGMPRLLDSAGSLHGEVMGLASPGRGVPAAKNSLVDRKSVV